MAKVNRLSELARETDENYLKAIMLIRLKKGEVYASDLVEHLENNTSTVYSALSKLVEHGYVKPYQGKRGAKANIEFTPTGDTLARRILQKHQQIQKWLMQLGIPAEEADEEACMMEHGLSENTMETIARHVELASQLLGDDAAYPEKMRRIAKKMRHTAEMRPEAMTETEKIVRSVEAHGGLSEIEEHSALIEAAGGKQQLADILAFIKEIGGLSGMKKLQKEMAREPGPELLLDSLTFLSSLGGKEKVKDSQLLIEELGGDEGLQQLLRLAQELGGLDKLLGIGRLGAQMLEMLAETKLKKSRSK